MRQFPINNVRDPLDNTGVVFRNRNVNFGFIPDRRGRHSDRTLLLAALTSALAGGALAALLTRSRR